MRRSTNYFHKLISRESVKGLLIFLLILLFPPCLEYGLRLCFSLFNNKYAVLTSDINRAFSEGDYESVRKHIDALSKLEKKYALNAKRSDYHSYIPTSREFYQSILDELTGEYENALEIRYALLENPSFSSALPFGYNDPYGIPRLLYKANYKEEAFREYCKVTNVQKTYMLPHFSVFYTHEHIGLAVPFVECSANSEELRNTCSQLKDYITYNVPFKDRISYYVSFPEFLKFAEEEYAKLGEPEEYADAMTVFRTINAELDEQTATPENAETPGQAEPQ